MTLKNPNTIWLKGMRRTLELPAGAAINPGYLVVPYNNSSVLDFRPHNIAGEMVSRVPLLVALEKEYLGSGINVDSGSYSSSSATAIQYSIGDTVIAGCLQSGDEVYMKLAADATAVVQGDFLESAGDGTIRKAIGPITDSTGGTGSTTFAAITAGGSYAQADIVAIKNALSETAVQLNKLSTIAMALESVDNSAGSGEVYIRALILG